MSKSDNWRRDVPYVDVGVEHVGVAYLRVLNARALATLDHLIVIRNGDTPLAVVMPYEMCLRWQRERRSKP